MARPLLRCAKLPAYERHRLRTGDRCRCTDQWYLPRARLRRRARLCAAPARGVDHYRKKAGELLDSLLEKRGHPGDPREPGIVELFARSLETVQVTITRLKLAAQPPDLLITIPRNACAFYEFHRAEELIEIGRRRTREALKRWHRPPPRRPG